MEYSNGMSKIVRELITQFTQSHPKERTSEYKEARRNFVQQGLQSYMRALEEEALVRHS